MSKYNKPSGLFSSERHFSFFGEHFSSTEKPLSRTFPNVRTLLKCIMCRNGPFKIKVIHRYRKENTAHFTSNDIISIFAWHRPHNFIHDSFTHIGSDNETQFFFSHFFDYCEDVRRHSWFIYSLT